MFFIPLSINTLLPRNVTIPNLFFILQSRIVDVWRRCYGLRIAGQKFGDRRLSELRAVTGVGSQTVKTAATESAVGISEI